MRIHVSLFLFTRSAAASSGSKKFRLTRLSHSSGTSGLAGSQAPEVANGVRHRGGPEDPGRRL